MVSLEVGGWVPPRWERERVLGLGWGGDDDEEEEEGKSHGAAERDVSRMRSSQSRVACRSRSFQRPWPKMNAYGFLGLVGGRRARKRESSSSAMGKRIICSMATSIVPAGQARESGSLSTTSAVLKIPWMEQALTLNW